MVFKEKEKTVTDIAWEQLYKRFEQEGLLSGKGILKIPSGRRSTPFTRVVAVAVLAAGALTALHFMRTVNIHEKDLQVIRNEADAPTLATMLHDGSIVYLSEQTSLKYPLAFDGNERKVMLQGEAFFEVRENEERPFFIDTDLATVEVTGTSFHVKSKNPSSFVLSVREGEVRASLKDRRRTVPVKAGETVSFRSGRLQLSKTGTGHFEKYFRRIHFKDERLDNMAQIINRISDSIRIKVAPEVEDRLITFTLSGNRDMEAVCLALNLSYQKRGDTIYISKQP